MENKNESASDSSLAFPIGLRYNLSIQQGVAGSRNLARFSAENPSTFQGTQNNVVRIPVSSPGFLDLKNAVLGFNIENTSTGGTTVVTLDGGANAILQRYRVLSNNGNEIERIDSLKSKGLDQLEIYLDIINNNLELEDVDSTLLFKNYGDISYTFFPMGSSYLVSLNSGRINYIEDLELIIALSKYYQNSYERIKANNFMFDEFLNKNFFKFRSILEDQKTINDKYKIINSGRFSEYILESKDRIISYQSYVLKDMKSSARNLLIIIEKNIDE